MKQLTLDNFLEPDPASLAIVQLRPDGSTEPRTPEYWAQQVLTIRPNDSVPQSIRDLHLAARAVFIYGFYFYPLYSVGQDQLLRVAESALTEVCSRLSCPSNKRTFAKKIEWMRNAGRFDLITYERWQSLRNLRNAGSHPAFQSVMPQPVVLQTVEAVTDLINHLYGAT